jgi:hypothetical protein
MAKAITMDVDKLKEALAILNRIPHDLHAPQGGGKPVDDLSQVQHLPDDLKGFGVNGGSASSWISQCVTDLYTYINTLVSDLEAQCGSIGTLMDNSIKAYTGGDADSSTAVNDAGSPVTPPVSQGKD